MTVGFVKQSICSYLFLSLYTVTSRKFMRVMLVAGMHLVAG